MLPLLGPDKVSSSRTRILRFDATKKTMVCIGELARVSEVVNPSLR